MSNCWVEVKSEPLHIEEYSNMYIRLYRADLQPGSETDFHKHSEDTIYMVLSGGSVITKLLKGTKSSPTYLPHSFSLKSKINLIIKRLLSGGSIELPKGFFFCMPSRDYPIIHKAKASVTNPNVVKLLGIEILKCNKRNVDVLNGNDFYKKEYENDKYCVFRLELEPNQSAGRISCFSGIIVVIEGTAVIPEQEEPLTAGEYLWRDINVCRDLYNLSNVTFKAMIVALKGVSNDTE